MSSFHCSFWLKSDTRVSFHLVPSASHQAAVRVLIKLDQLVVSNDWSTRESWWFGYVWKWCPNPQWNSHLVGIMISKTIGDNRVHNIFRQTHSTTDVWINRQPDHSDEKWRGWLNLRSEKLWTCWTKKTQHIGADPCNTVKVPVHLFLLSLYFLNHSVSMMWSDMVMGWHCRHTAPLRLPLSPMSLASRMANALGMGQKHPYLRGLTSTSHFDHMNTWILIVRFLK